MDPKLHQKQAVNHLNRVLGYAPMVADDGAAQVHLTEEDWWVVADALFKMDTPEEMLPDALESYGLKNENRTIHLKTAELAIDVDIM
ncbi:MAG: hypothetical protein GVY15_12570 [Bacteroidetes bacterium]|jgi:hypothetical protein|nr:hypothetical protein [Bacteroidota bacterium]